MCGVFAEFERAMIQERVKVGLARAKEKGTRIGKAIGRPKVLNAKKIDTIITSNRFMAI